MDINLYFNFAAMFLSLTVLVSYYLKGNIPQKDYLAFGNLCWIVFIANVLEFVCILQRHLFFLNPLFNKSVIVCYFLCRFFIIISCVIYLLLATEAAAVMQKIVKIILILFIISGVVLIIGSCWFNWLFCFDESGSYYNGQYIIGYYFINVVFYFFFMIYLLKYGQNIHYIKRIAMVALMIFPVLGVAVQYFFPKINDEGFGFSIGLLWLFLSMPKNEFYYDESLKILNQCAFDSKVNKAIKNKASFQTIIMNVKSKRYILEQCGMEFYHKILRNIINNYSQYVKRDELFYLGDGRFVAFAYSQNTESNVSNAENVIRKVKDEIILPMEENRIKIGCALLSSETDVKAVNDIYNFFEYLDVNGIITEGKVNIGKNIDITKAKRTEHIEQAIERAVNQTSFEIYYQPIYDLREKKIVAAEALLRMYDKDLGMVSPDEFIPVAEKNGSILRIGEIVLDKVCQFLNNWSVAELGIRYVEVNLSAIECTERSLPEKVVSIMDKYQIPHNYINLEITETALANNTKVLSDNMYRLRKAGISFSLDDYGTGYSNINYILNLPFKIVKIDKSLLWESLDNEKAVIALNASMNMIHDMGMEIVVEGVETIEMVEMLSNMKCDYLQGFYYSKPLKQEEFISFMHEEINK